MELKIDRISKQYGAKIAVDRVCLTLKPGVTGLLGANGAGKTTLMRILCGILKASSGEVSFGGYDVYSEEYRAQLGYLPQNFGFYLDFTGRDFLLYMSSLKGLDKNMAKKRSEELLLQVGLHEQANKKIKTYSGGMKQRLGIAQVLLNNPKIVILDEPTVGLDPRERVRFRELIAEVGKENIVLLSTHIVFDVERMADRILLMKDGQIVFDGKQEDVGDNLETLYMKYFTEERV